MILVTGASGKVGGQALRRLVEKGLAVRTFSRDPSKIEALGMGVEAVQGDLDRADTIPPAVAGVDKVLIVAGGWDIPTDDMVTSTVADLLGRPARTFREWTAANAGAFA